MRKVNWKATEKAAIELKRKVKSLASATSYLQDRPEVGYFVDNISKNKVKLKECKISTLRRYVSLLDRYYFLVSSQVDKQYILDKKIEIELEISIREQIKKE